jgi:DNA-directed RNA polymerase subunit beta'
MGHIALAAPVTHIWFTKGIPSRLALLMDITPKILESVVYFDSYAVTAVDEETRLLEQARLDKMIESEVNTLSGGVALNLAEMQSEKDTEVNAIETEQVTEVTEIESEYQLKVLAVEEVAKNYLKEFKKLVGQDAKLKQSAKFGNRIFAKRGIIVDEVLLTLLAQPWGAKLSRLRFNKPTKAGLVKVAFG